MMAHKITVPKTRKEQKLPSKTDKVKQVEEKKNDKIKPQPT